MQDDEPGIPGLLIITVPLYNDAHVLRGNLEMVQAALSSFGYNYLLVLADDGSTDGTEEVARQLLSEDSRLRYFRVAVNQGRGSVLAAAWRKFQGGVYLFFDSDLSTDLKHIPALVRGVLGGYDIVTGSRYLSASRTTRPPLRRFVSLTYNLLVRMLFRDDISDHQCGFKVFSARAVKTLFPLCQDRRWFWDTEILVIAGKVGCRVLEVPVEWEEKKGTRTPIRRLVGDSYALGKGLARLFVRLYFYSSKSVRRS